MSKLNFKNQITKTTTLLIAALSLMNTACTKEQVDELTHGTVSGTVTGLSGTLVLEDNNGDQVTMTGDGDFTFPSEVSITEHYHIAVAQQPDHQTCSVQNASGSVAMSEVHEVVVYCSHESYFVGVTVTGLTGTLQILNNGTDVTTINADGSYAFPTYLAEGTTYNVTVVTQPSGQTCVVTNGSGTISDDVTDIVISCGP
jgi:hypothetical protein